VNIVVYNRIVGLVCRQQPPARIVLCAVITVHCRLITLGETDIIFCLVELRRGYSLKNFRWKHDSKHPVSYVHMLQAWKRRTSQPDAKSPKIASMFSIPRF